ncbi:TraE/TraK family type IV conjugative transfer system protein [Duganella vulcania]|uniref:Uncharacterized protein n=1 Tax=Duganella vulcania TaxID=2692166 RepID=A0A845GIZ1_9BURK|nr:TraE/TraK family type IV conjugative transfer system protein [Duganella vulcania]MYM92717.1 hypothetical protein [Duganella vulcania]
MNLKNFSATWRGLKAENKLFRILLPVLVFSVAILSWAVANKKDTVILVPPTIPEQMNVSFQKASGGFKKSWGLFVSSMAGNVTPGNVEFVRQSLQDMMSAQAWHTINESLASQTQIIKDENLTIRFEPRDVYFEEQSDRVFVTGSSTITGPGGRSNKKNRVFELAIAIAGYAPKIVGFDSYDGDPHTLEFIEREAKRLKKSPAEVQADLQAASSNANPPSNDK